MASDYRLLPSFTGLPTEGKPQADNSDGHSHPLGQGPGQQHPSVITATSPEDLSVRHASTGRYECTHCGLSTHDFALFTGHVDAAHPDVMLNPVYVCTACGVRTPQQAVFAEHNAQHHPSLHGMRLRVIKRHDRTLLEQSPVTPLSSSSSSTSSSHSISSSTISWLSSQPKYKSSNISSAESLPGVTSQMPTSPHECPPVSSPDVEAATMAGMDGNGHLATAFARFPYPSPGDVAFLASVTPYSEERIRAWFGMQRLRAGISWSPDEIEAARRQLIASAIAALRDGLCSNAVTATAAPPPPPVITVLPTSHIAALHSPLPSVSTNQSSPNASTQSQSPFLTASPLNLSRPPMVPPSPRHLPVSFPSPSHPSASSTLLTSSSATTTTKRHRKHKKSKEQLAALKASFVRSQHPDDGELRRLMERTGLGRSEIKKWFSDSRYHQRSVQTGGVAGRLAARPLPTIPPTDSGSSTEAVVSLPPSCQDEEQSCNHDTGTSAIINHTQGSDMATETESAKQHSNIFVGNVQTSPSLGRGKGTNVGARPKKTAEQLFILKSVFHRTQWPSAEEYAGLQGRTGLPRSAIVRWFGDTRFAFKHGQLRWMRDEQRCTTVPGPPSRGGGVSVARRGRPKGYKRRGARSRVDLSVSPRSSQSAPAWDRVARQIRPT
uniref:Homeobox domain-containing protein n=1 Tax=Eptatretus burgeri TaxID=7764 RepID=A0A8C4R7W8_EPTBU